MINWLLTLFSTRFLVLLLAGMVMAAQIPLHSLNQYWLQWSSSIHSQSGVSTHPRPLEVTLPAAVRSNAVGHPVLSNSLFALMQQQIQQGGTAVLLLPSPPLLSATALAELDAKAKLVSRQKQLSAWQKSGQLIIGVSPSAAPASMTKDKQRVVADPAASSTLLPPPISRALNLQPPELPATDGAHSGIALWPGASPEEYGYPLIYQSDQQWYASVLLPLARQYLSPALQWVPNRGFVNRRSGDTSPLVSASDGRIFALVPNGDMPPTEAVNLKEASSLAGPKVLLVIDATLNGQGSALTAAIQALQHQHYLRSVPWNRGAETVGLLLITAYLLLVMPLLGLLRGVACTLALGISLMAGQLILQRLYGYWVPLAEPLVLLLGGAALMMIQVRQQQRYKQLQQRFQARSLQLGSTLYHQGQLDEAASALDGCDTSEALLGLTYDIAHQQEQTQDLQGALVNYTRIQQRKRQFKDVGKRIAKLNGELGDTLVDVPLATTQTMMLPEQNGTTPHLGRYEVVREIGRGAMGVVYLGRDPRIARNVAIKTLTYAQFEPTRIPEMKSRFFREAEAAGRLNHPNIVTVFDMGEEPNLAFISMDYAKGSPLNRHCKPGSLLPVKTVYRIVADVADALSYAHQNKIVHRDIKPGNIMFDADSGEVKVTDFGIARISDDSQTRTGSILGSPLYMSPEQIKGAKVTGAADIYSLGVTFYQLLTGELPFNGENIASLTHQIVNSKFKSVRTHRSDLPASAVRIVNKALQKKTSDRYQDAAEMAEALRKSITKEFAREPA
ncbi:serine/threonine-protein kinase [Aestuariirhabdus sp. LZHN29]|uniref:serine/threonine-protein kinase n=1 Tax=Aestuariirhabdus sp. LZHN29 TaxID=3417462 RepID=UPI003CF3953B